MLVVAAGAGLFIGLSLGALGGGGSILAVPVLVYLLGQSPTQATTGSLVVVGLTAAVGAVTLAGAATAVAGPIGFVGLAVPHLCRLLVGVDHRWLLPFSAVLGAALLTTADVVGRLVARPAEVDVGIVTALLGAPVFIAIVRRQKVRAL